MPLQELCVICAKQLPIPRRADARYCRSPSTCRVHAFRAIKQGRAQPGVFKRADWRLPAAESVSLGVRMGTLLAAFRVLRQEQKRSTDLATQLAQAEKDAAQQRADHEKERVDFLDAARRQIVQLEAKHLETQALVEIQKEATTQATARWTVEQQRATKLADRITDMEREVSAQRTASVEPCADLAEASASVDETKPPQVPDLQAMIKQQFLALRSDPWQTRHAEAAGVQARTLEQQGPSARLSEWERLSEVPAKKEALPEALPVATQPLAAEPLAATLAMGRAYSMLTAALASALPEPNPSPLSVLMLPPAREGAPVQKTAEATMDWRKARTERFMQFYDKHHKGKS